MFNSKSIKKMAGTTLAAIAVSVAAVAPAAIAQPVVHVRLTAGVNHSGDRDPRLHEALRHLKAAETELQNADRDSAGHREKALDLVQRAIEETHKAIRHDH